MGTVLAVFGVLAVLFVASLVATRDGELLVDAPRDHPDAGLPEAGPVQAHDLERVRFGMALRGYRMAEVDDLLDRVAVELRDRDDRIRLLEQGSADGPAGAEPATGPPPARGSYRVEPTGQVPGEGRRPGAPAADGG